MDALARTLFDHDFRSVELEFRIGVNGKHDVGEQRWKKLKTSLGKETRYARTVEKIVKSSNGTASRYVIGQDKPVWMHKKRVHVEDTQRHPWNIRTAISLESTEPAGEPPRTCSFQRTKERHSFECGAWTIDMTKVASVPPIDVDTEHSYEVEIELTDHFEFFSKELDEVIREGKHIASDLIARMS